MKVLRLIYVLVWLYFVYCACNIIYEVIGNKAIPLFVSGGILFLLKWVTEFLTIMKLKKLR